MTMAKEQTNEAPAPKKGKSSWRPASMLDLSNKDPNYRYRWVSKEPGNMMKKTAEGWVPANKINGGGSAEHLAPGLIQDGKQLDGNINYRESVLMVIPEEKAKERDSYFSDQTARQTLSLKSMADEMNEKSAQAHRVAARGIHGSITIERGPTVIK
jgi:hypothetical protein